MTDGVLKIIFRDTGYNSNSLNVLAGALCSRRIFSLEIVFVNKFESLIKYLQSSLKPILVCYSFSSLMVKQVEEEFARLRELNLNNEHIKYIAGGPHPTAKPVETLTIGFDYVCTGEGEKFICDFIKLILEGILAEKLPGLGLLKNGKYEQYGLAERIELDDFPPFAEPYKRFNPIEITRGCIYGCNFCQTPIMFKARFRHRSIENIKYYVQLMSKYGLRDIRFITPSALSYGSVDESVNISAVEQLLSVVRGIIGEDGRLFFGTFPSEVRPEHLTPETLKLLKKYVSNTNLVIGGQSGSDNILKKAHRGHNVDVILAATRYCKEAGFQPNVDFIFGFPDETEEDTLATIELIKKLIEYGAKIHAHWYIPLPGTAWGKRKPSKIDEKLLPFINKLIGNGNLYGQWMHQKAFVEKSFR